MVLILGLSQETLLITLLMVMVMNIPNLGEE